MGLLLPLQRQRTYLKEKHMNDFRLKKLADSYSYEYIVCEYIDCENEGSALTMTETRFVDLCKQHYDEYRGNT